MKFDSNDTFWALFWVLMTTAFLAVVCAFPLYYTHQQRVIAEMVKRGSDPIKAACAVRGMESTGFVAVCTTAASHP